MHSVITDLVKIEVLFGIMKENRNDGVTIV